MRSTIITTIDRAGRLVIPKEIRDAAGLEPETPLEITLVERAIEIRVAPREVTFHRKGRFLVARPKTPGSPLDAGTVTATRDAIRRRRERS